MFVPALMLFMQDGMGGAIEGAYLTLSTDAREGRGRSTQAGDGGDAVERGALGELVRVASLWLRREERRWREEWARGLPHMRLLVLRKD